MTKNLRFLVKTVFLKKNLPESLTENVKMCFIRDMRLLWPW